MKWKKTVTITAVALLVVSIFIFTRMGGEFIPTLEEGDFAVETRLLTGSSLSQTLDKVDQASRILVNKFPEVKEVIGKVGAAEIPTDPMPMEACDLTIILKDKKEWTTTHSREELAEKMSKALEDIPGVTFGFSQPIQLRSNELISGVRQDIGIKIFGDDLQTLTELSQKIGKIVSSVQGAKDLYLEQATGLPQIVVNLNRDRIAQYGLSVKTVNQAINAAFAGQAAGQVYEGEQRYDITVRFSQQNRQGIEDVKNVYVTAPNGNQVPLEQLADISFKIGPNQIQREDAKRRIIVGLNVRGRDIQSVVEEIESKINQQIKMPAGYYITYGGQFENLKQASDRLSIAVPVALLLILLLLYFSFGSFKHSLLIFSAIPMAAIGGIFALLLRGMPFSISAGVGFIALFGVAVLNGIVLITEFNRLKKEGSYTIDQIVLMGTEIRLRPVLMTATVASLGFLPMALSTAAGAEVQKPLATVVIGGLVTSTILTLIVLPVLYTYFENIKLGGKKGVNKAVVTLLAITGLSIAGSSVFAQAKPDEGIGLQQAIQVAVSNNQQIRSSNLNIGRQQALRGSALDIGKTNFNLQYGQFNSIKRDNNFSVTQSIPFPGLFAKQRSLYDAQIQSAELGLSVVQKEISYRVKSTYGRIVYLNALRDLYLSQDSVYSNFYKAAAARYNAGETNLLEKTTAETQYNEVRNRIAQNQADILANAAELKRLMNTRDSVRFLFVELEPEQWNITQRDTNSVGTNPVLAFQRQQIEVAERQVKVERARSGPDFNVGYFNQSIIGLQNVDGQDRFYSGGTRFQGITAGISIPVFFKPYASRIKAAKIDKQVAQSEEALSRANLLGSFEQAYQELSKNAKSISYYKASALPNADLILKQAQVAFQAGEIGYVEYLQGIRTYSEIRLGYLGAINDFNQSVYTLQYLTGQ